GAHHQSCAGKRPQLALPARLGNAGRTATVEARHGFEPVSDGRCRAACVNLEEIGERWQSFCTGGSSASIHSCASCGCLKRCATDSRVGYNNQTSSRRQTAIYVRCHHCSIDPCRCGGSFFVQTPCKQLD